MEATMKVCVVLSLALSLTACLPEPLAVNTDPVVDAEIQKSEADTIEVEPIQKNNPEESWALVTDSKRQFSVPSGWTYSTTENKESTSRSANYVIRVQDTDKEVVLGAVGLDEECVTELNDPCQVADDYSAINVMVYEGEVDFWDLSWTDFFNDYYPEVLTFESFVLACRPELNAVMVTKTDGVWLGQKRTFIHSKDAFFDITYFTTRINEAQNEKMFWDFIQNFGF